MMPNSFLIMLGEFSPCSDEPIYSFGQASLYIHEPNKRFMKVSINAGFQVFIGEAHIQEADSSPTLNPPVGTLITFSEENHILTITCDRLGTATVYWKKDGHCLLISNRKENLMSKTDRPDWHSIQQYLYTGFTINDSTLIKDISQTEPNTLLTVSLKPEPRVSVAARTDHSADMITESKDLIDQIANQLSKKLSASIPSVLMMSAGWDSRTLLLEGSANLSGAYSHGDLSSREINLTRQLTGAQRLDHLFVDVQSCRITPSLIDLMLKELGSGIFPIWFIAARNISAWKDAPIMSGVLGELLGGHYGLMSWGSRTEKLFSSLLLLNDSLVKEKQVHASIDRYCSPPKSHWFISDYGQEILDESRKETKERAQNAIESYYKETGSWQRGLEDFNMAHRARQYILKQAQAAANTVGYTIPFADEHLTDLVRSLEFKKRIHNKANQRILQTRNASLLKEPMAATLIAAKYPILFQELSRFFRIARENITMALGKERPRLGWFNYEHLYEDNLLHNLTDSLSSDLWDKEKMHRTLNFNPENRVDAGSTLDMISKIKTVDHILTSAELSGKGS